MTGFKNTTIRILKKARPYALTAVFSLFFVCLSAFAQAQQFENPLQFDTLQEFLEGVLDAVILIAFPILVLFLVYSGFLFISAQGNPQKLSEARKVFIWTLIGSLLILGAKALSIAINNTVNELQG